IQWLEDTLLNTQIAIIFVTHDRSLLQRLATRIIELDRGKLTSWPGDYQNFIRRKEEMLHAEAKQNSDFDKKLAQEEQWIRQGIKARRTRNEGRVRALEAMRLERAKRRDLQGKVSFNVNPGQQSGNLVIEAENITHGFEDSVTIKNFSTRIMRGDRIGLIGPNGIGKSTLLNILLGKLMPQQGKVIHGTKLQVAYFDQMRHALDLEKNVADNVVQGSDFIEINNRKQHIISYLNDFLFTPERARTPVKALSGGERSRLFLAKLFSQPANLLVMDEPTNDLDVETLELLEELLSNFQGTLLLVSHDRTFLDNVVTGTLVFEGEGCITEFVGGYQDWLRQKPPISKTLKPEASKKVIDKPKSNKKLSYKDERELEGLPAYIEKLEAEQNTLQIKISAPDFYQQDSKIITETLEKLTGLSSELEKAYLRWEELEQAKR
ncbi:MAG TPA: ATP-binding cassette domain-containing protein, partial [Gammaproteobacteria bacterium]|nr:ATP-binding cassette domain-containing protein [Gammaproteobacteria bacterium]